jgi:tRNA-modifying protein YgfZ
MAASAVTSPTTAEATPEQYAALTTGCALVDRSERGKLALTGTDAKSFLNGQVTNDVEALMPGAGCYAALLTHKGKMLADLRVLDTGDELLLDTERVALQNLFDAIRRFKVGYAVELHKRTLERGLLSLIGPTARQVAGATDLPETEHANRRAEVAGIPAVLALTDVGVDLICASGDTAALHAALEAAGALPVPEAAAEVVRIERGRPRYGIDVDDSVIPQEAALNARAVSFTKGCYVGQETVARLYYKGKPNRHLRGLRLSEAVLGGTALRAGDREVGILTSVAASPRLGPIGLALVRRQAEPGTRLQAGSATADVVELPF